MEQQWPDIAPATRPSTLADGTEENGTTGALGQADYPSLHDDVRVLSHIEEAHDGLAEHVDRLGQITTPTIEVAAFGWVWAEVAMLDAPATG